MLNIYAGYSLSAIFAIIISVYYIRYIRINKLNNKILRYVLLIILLYFIGVLFAKTYFPMPVYPSVIESGFHEVNNYPNPFYRVIDSYNKYVVNGNLSFSIFIKDNISFILFSIFKFISIGFFVKSFFQPRFRRFSVMSLMGALIFELSKYVVNVLVGTNYIAFLSENIVYHFVGMLIGYKIYKITINFCNRLSQDSDILNFIETFLTITHNNKVVHNENIKG